MSAPLHTPSADGSRILALYTFVTVEDPSALRDDLHAECARLGLKGTLLVAREGVNGTIAGAPEAVTGFAAWLRAEPRLRGLRSNTAAASEPPFKRLKVKLRKEIVTLGVAGVAPERATGIHVAPEEWNALIADPEVLLLDTRNAYESRIGTFAGALIAGTASFREFPEFVAAHLDPAEHRRVAMFCTGGIRCEKASAYLLGQGFERVYQLDGGILSYLASVPAHQSAWQGECFVFDERVAVDQDLEPGGYVQCFACRRPLSPDDLASDRYEPAVSCPYCFDETDAEQRARFAERRRQVELARARSGRHLGTPSGGET